MSSISFTHVPFIQGQIPDECAIELGPIDCPAKVLPCGHIFSKDAILTWLQLKQTCPLDQQRVTEVQIQSDKHLSLQASRLLKMFLDKFPNLTDEAKRTFLDSPADKLTYDDEVSANAQAITCTGEAVDALCETICDCPNLSGLSIFWSIIVIQSHFQSSFQYTISQNQQFQNATATTVVRSYISSNYES